MLSELANDDVTLSLVVVTHRRANLLGELLPTLLPQLSLHDEVLLLVNGSDPETDTLLETILDARVKITVLSPRPRSSARNFGLGKAKGEIVYFLDDDVTLPSHLLEQLRTLAKNNPEFTVFGGPNLTPEKSSRREKLFGAVMTSPFCAPMVWRRYSEGGPARFCTNEHDLILCNLAVRKKDVTPALAFKDLTSNEENLFLYECQRLGLKACYDPRFFVFHRRRTHFKSFLSQVFSYGRGRAEQTLSAPLSAHPLFFVPALSLLALAISIASPSWRAFLPSLFLVYFAGSTLGVFFSREIGKLGLGGAFLCVGLTPFVHVAYGGGFLRGIFGAVPENFRAVPMTPPVVEST